MYLHCKKPKFCSNGLAENAKSLEEEIKLFTAKELHKLRYSKLLFVCKMGLLLALLSRGDSKLTDYLIAVYKQGGKSRSVQKKCARELGIDTDYYAIQN